LTSTARWRTPRGHIATTTSRANVDVLLAITLADRPANCFEVIGVGEQATANKPAPDIYRWVLNQPGLPGDPSPSRIRRMACVLRWVQASRCW
jgi:beta-phosphoglucomutase-like phosphatase (HAD superfamily)